MQEYFGVIIIALFITMVITRSLSLKKQGIAAVEFGQKDKKDFIIPPFALFYLYLIIANTFKLPTISGQRLFYSEIISWLGVFSGFLSLLFFLWTLISFKKSFRVGLVNNTSEGLITTGAFVVSRNPIYLSFAIMLFGQFMIYPSWILLLYIVAGIFTFHRQVLKEEKFLETLYGNEFDAYCKKVRRYL